MPTRPPILPTEYSQDLYDQLCNVQNSLRPALSYRPPRLFPSRPSGRGRESGRRHGYRFDSEETNTAHDSITYLPTDSATQWQSTTFDYNESDNVYEIRGPSRPPSPAVVPVELVESTHVSVAASCTRSIPPCYILATLGFIVIGGSLAVGLYYSIAKDRMGDGFTTAGWMTAAGTLILAAPMARHYPHCQCWDNTTRRANRPQQMAFA